MAKARRTCPRAYRVLGSRLEELFWIQCRATLATLPVRELEGVVPGRKFKADFAWPEHHLIVEVDGGTWRGTGAHSSGAGAERDREKTNLLVLGGWKVLRVTGDQVRSGQAIGWTRQALGLELPVAAPAVPVVTRTTRTRQSGMPTSPSRPPGILAQEA